MNEDFYKAQAARIRQIAQTADPFIKKRLLNLAQRYDVRFDPPHGLSHARAFTPPENTGPVREE